MWLPCPILLDMLLKMISRARGHHHQDFPLLPQLLLKSSNWSGIISTSKPLQSAISVAKSNYSSMITSSLCLATMIRISCIPQALLNIKVLLSTIGHSHPDCLRLMNPMMLLMSMLPPLCAPGNCLAAGLVREGVCIL